MREIGFSEIKGVSLDILKDVAHFCDTHDIRYVLAYGTMLGAVRHKGFIPWDDDIDICMPREDYEKFLLIASSELQNGYVLQHYSVDKKTPSYFAKVRKNGTRFVEESVVNIPIHQGIFIDIFPIDKIPDDLALRKRFIKQVTFWNQLYISKNITKPSLPHSKIRRIVYGVIRRCIHVALIPISRDWLYKKLDLSLRRFNHLECNMLSCMGMQGGEHIRTDIYPLKKILFEDIYVNMPSNAEKILTDEYGDYMKLPPVDKRIGHSPKYFSLDTDEEF